MPVDRPLWPLTRVARFPCVTIWAGFYTQASTTVPPKAQSDFRILRAVAAPPGGFAPQPVTRVPAHLLSHSSVRWTPSVCWCSKVPRAGGLNNSPARKVSSRDWGLRYRSSHSLALRCVVHTELATGCEDAPSIPESLPLSSCNP